MAEMLGTECEALGRNVSDMNVEELDWLYCHLGREMLALRIVPPAWYAPWERERICTAILRYGLRRTGGAQNLALAL